MLECTISMHIYRVHTYVCTVSMLLYACMFVKHVHKQIMLVLLCYKEAVLVLSAVCIECCYKEAVFVLNTVIKRPSL